MSGHDDLAIGVVGAGRVASEVHIPALLNVHGARIAWVVDRDFEQARHVARAFGVPHERMPADPGDLPPADVVLLAIPYGARRPFFAAMAARKSAIYVEKPFARTLAQHDEQCRGFEPHRVAVGFQRRCVGGASALRELLQRETLGELRRMRVEFGRPGVSTGGRYSDDLEMAGGGVLFEVGLHSLDFALNAADATATQVVSGSMSRESGFDVHTEASVGVTRRTGAPALLDLIVTSLVHTTMDVEFETEKATLRINIFGDNVLRMTPHGSNLEIALGGRGLDVPRTGAQVFHAHWCMFLDGIRSGRTSAACAEECRVTTQLIEQLYALGEPS